MALVAGILPCTSVAQTSEPKIVVTPRPLPDRIDFVRRTRDEWFQKILNERINKVVVLVRTEESPWTAFEESLVGSGNAAFQTAAATAVAKVENNYLRLFTDPSVTFTISVRGEYFYPNGGRFLAVRKGETNFVSDHSSGAARIPRNVREAITSPLNSREISNLPIELPGVTRMVLYKRVEREIYEGELDFERDLRFDSSYLPTQIKVGITKDVVLCEASDDMIEALANREFVGIYGESGQANRYRVRDGQRVPMIPVTIVWQGIFENDFVVTLRGEPEALLDLKSSNDFRSWAPIEHYRTGSSGWGYITVPHDPNIQSFFLDISLAPQ